MKPSKHPHVHIAFSLLVAAFTLAPVRDSSAAEPPKPNIVFIYSDDDLSCCGSTWLQAPNIDRLASDRIDFQQFMCSTPSVLQAGWPTSHYGASRHGRLISELA